MRLGLIVLVMGVSILSGCTTPHVVERKQASDSRLSCSQLDAEISKAESYRRQAQKEKGMTGTNVAAAIIFFPAIMGNQQNADKAIQAAEARKRYLLGLKRQKGCS